jgi:hypothetical protein
MAAKLTPQSTAAALTCPNGCCCSASPRTPDWQVASITRATAQQMMVRGLIERDRAAMEAPSSGGFRLDLLN